jgi:rhombotail lipoprotein
MKLVRPIITAASLALLVGLSFGCAGFYGSHDTRRQSSTVEFLYPKGKDLKQRPTIPHMTLPISVGIAFVPESEERRRRGYSIAEADKRDLLEQVAAQFRELPYVSRIEIIPSAYLQPGGGFRNLDQISAMHDVDVIALTAFDQAQHSDEGLLPITYLTVVGAYVMPGEKNDTSTMLDTAVYHVPSRKLLFRAPGTSRVKGRSTLINADAERRKDSAEGFAVANEEMTANLKIELDRFKLRLKQEPEQYVIAHKPGYKGGGATGPAMAALLTGALAVAQWRRKRKV